MIPIYLVSKSFILKYQDLEHHADESANPLSLDISVKVIFDWQ